jgi:hypothetical protein
MNFLANCELPSVMALPGVMISLKASSIVERERKRERKRETDRQTHREREREGER